MLQLFRNLNGRRPAGYRKAKTQRVNFFAYNPTVYTCAKTDSALLHHVDDVRLGASDPTCKFLQSKEGVGKFMDMKNGSIEIPGTEVTVLGRTKLRTADAYLTLLDAKHRDTCPHAPGPECQTIESRRTPHRPHRGQYVTGRREPRRVVSRVRGLPHILENRPPRHQV